MKRSKIIGLTGQSGAGKSTASRLFSRHGFMVINADSLVAQIYESGSVCLRAVAAVFGKDIMKADGSLDRRLLAQRAFSSEENTALLGQIVHPFVLAEMLRRIKEASGAVVIDAPQLFESNIDAICDITVSVLADENSRLKRILERDHISETQARERMNAQYDDDFFRSNSDYIIENNGSLTALERCTEELIQALKAEVM